MRTRFRKLALLGAALMVMSVAAQAATATTAKTYTRMAAYHVDADLRFQGCGAKYVALDWSTGVTLGTENYTFFLSNNLRKTHVAQTSGDLSLVFQTEENGQFRLQQASNGKTLPVGGNPWVFLAFLDGDGNITDFDQIGRCRDLLGTNAHAETDISQAVYDTLLMDGASCQNHPGPYLEITAGTDGPGVDAMLILTNNKKKAYEWSTSGGVVPPGFHWADADGYVSLQPTDGKITVRKGGRLDMSDGVQMWGPGGNPWIWAYQTNSAPTLSFFKSGEFTDEPIARCKNL